MPAFQLSVLISIAKHPGDHTRMINLHNGSKKKKVWDFNRFTVSLHLISFMFLLQRGVSGILKVSTKTWRLGTRGTYHFLSSILFLFVLNLGTDGLDQSIFIWRWRRHWIFPTRLDRLLPMLNLPTVSHYGGPPPTREEDLISRLDDTTQFIIYGKA